jgi:glycosyltransferase involved in cell wall biosynthesis
MPLTNIKDGERPDLVVIGVHASSEAYPNTKYRLEALRNTFQVTEVEAPLWAVPGGRIGIANRPLRGAWNAVHAHIAILLRYLAMRRPMRAYVPYPSIMLLILWSLLPRRMRPRWIVADAFISIYDTVVNDRKLLPPESWRAGLLRRAERRAYATADRVVVDTAENGAFYARIFMLPDKLFVPIPLSTNETDYRFEPYHAVGESCQVLFIGTLIPLHGIDTIMKAAALLQQSRNIQFLIIGDGQERDKVQQAIDTGLVNVDWDRSWKSPAELAVAIRRSDICLGVFGASDKTQRVCPYKLYTYSAVGRAIVTADTIWLKNSAHAFGRRPFSAVPAADPEALAERIAILAKMPDERADLARSGHRFYMEKLGNQNALSRLTACLMETQSRDA